MGYDYVERVDSPDAFPEEQPNAIELLAEGDEGILNIGANSLTVRSTSNISDTSHYTDSDILDDMLQETDENDLFLVKNKSAKKQKTSLTTTDAAALAGSTLSSSEQQPRRLPSTLEQNSSRQTGSNRPGRTTNARKRCPDRLGTQLQDAREDFAELAERQISCMEMFAKTMQQMANNDKERNEILRTLIESQRTRDEAFSQMSLMLKECIDV